MTGDSAGSASSNNSGGAGCNGEANLLTARVLVVLNGIGTAKPTKIGPVSDLGKLHRKNPHRCFYSGYAYALVFCLISATAWGQSPPILPDQILTPGAVATTDKTDICGKVNGLTYTKRHRVWTHQKDTFAKYHITNHRPHEWEDDDRIPVCLGADNSDPRNHWPQPSDKLVGKGLGFESKDAMDAGSCRLVCQGRVSVTEAQSWFLMPDWRDGLKAYRKANGK